jgi:hypothetical protein
MGCEPKDQDGGSKEDPPYTVKIRWISSRDGNSHTYLGMSVERKVQDEPARFERGAKLRLWAWFLTGDGLSPTEKKVSEEPVLWMRDWFFS